MFLEHAENFLLKPSQSFLPQPFFLRRAPVGTLLFPVLRFTILHPGLKYYMIDLADSQIKLSRIVWIFLKIMFNTLYISPIDSSPLWPLLGVC